MQFKETQALKESAKLNVKAEVLRAEANGIIVGSITEKHTRYKFV
ncbi:MAG: hypothetical protein ABH811_00995 [archaeon]